MFVINFYIFFKIGYDNIAQTFRSYGYNSNLRDFIFMLIFFHYY